MRGIVIAATAECEINHVPFKLKHLQENLMTHHNRETKVCGNIKLKNV